MVDFALFANEYNISSQSLLGQCKCLFVVLQSKAAVGQIKRMHSSSPTKRCISLKHSNVAAYLFLSHLHKIACMSSSNAFITIGQNTLLAILSYQLLMNHAYIMQSFFPKNTGTLDEVSILKRIMRHKIAERNHNDIKPWLPMHHIQNACTHFFGVKEILIRIEKDNNLSCCLSKCIVAC